MNGPTIHPAILAGLLGRSLTPTPHSAAAAARMAPPCAAEIAKTPPLIAGTAANAISGVLQALAAWHAKYDPSFDGGPVVLYQPNFFFLQSGAVDPVTKQLARAVLNVINLAKLWRSSYFNLALCLCRYANGFASHADTIGGDDWSYLVQTEYSANATLHS
jgi:hypothetical protein